MGAISSLDRGALQNSAKWSTWNLFGDGLPHFITEEQQSTL